MDVMVRMEHELQSGLRAKGWRCRGGHRFVSATHVVDVVPGGPGDRVTVFLGRCARPGDPSRLADCSRITLVGADEVRRFLARF